VAAIAHIAIGLGYSRGGPASRVRWRTSHLIMPCNMKAGLGICIGGPSRPMQSRTLLRRISPMLIARFRRSSAKARAETKGEQLASSLECLVDSTPTVMAANPSRGIPSLADLQGSLP